MDKVGAVLSEHNRLSPSPAECAAPAQDLILQVDGGHIPIQEKGQRSFEALAAIVYRPENIQAVDRHHRQIMEKTCVISARDDQLQTIKTSVINAAKKARPIAGNAGDSAGRWGKELLVGCSSHPT